MPETKYLACHCANITYCVHLEELLELIEPPRLMIVFVTVGSTRFDALVEAVISEAVLSTLRDLGYDRLILQRGNSIIKSEESDPESYSIQQQGVEIEIWKYKPSIQAEFEQADLIISHAGELPVPNETNCKLNIREGSGTILDVLRLGKPLIVVPNPTLLDNHQEELASALQAQGYLKATSIQWALLFVASGCSMTSTARNLASTIASFEPHNLVPFPPFDGSRFSKLVDEEMGFI
jgi:beta-1,4-N-acetylglucosaminyltransferase